MTFIGSVIGMKIKTIFIASILLTGFSATAQAQNIESNDGDQISCKTAVECKNFDVMFSELKVNNEVVQRTRTQSTRRQRSRKKIYIGGSPIFFFPGEFEEVEDEGETVNPSTGSGIGLFAGFNFSDLIGVDLERFIASGDTEPLSSYEVRGSFINPRFTFILNKNNLKSPYAYISPGIGIARLELEDVNFLGDSVRTVGAGNGLGLQMKAGLGLPLSETFHIFGQARYFQGFDLIEIVSSSETQGFSAFGLEAGISFNFGGY